MLPASISQYHVLSAGAVLLVVGMLGLMEVGFRAGLRRRVRHGTDIGSGLAATDAAVFGLLGLLLAFTFSGAASRRQDRLALVVREANAIGTAYMRLDLLAPAERAPLKASFREYIDARLSAYEAAPDLDEVRQELDRAQRLQREIWSGSVAAAERASPWTPPTLLLVPAMNAMIDVTGEREMVLFSHPPKVVFALLYALALLGALLAGFAMSAAPRRSVLHMLIFPALTSLTIYVIVDLEYPRLGLIRIDAADQMLTQVRAQMD